MRVEDTVGVNFPVATVMIIDRLLENCIKQVELDPKRYTFAFECLKQIRQAVILEYKCKCVSSLN